MIIAIFYNLYLLLLIFCVMCFNNNKCNCEEIDQQLQKYVHIVHSPKQDSSIFKPNKRKSSNIVKRSLSSHDVLPWHVETNVGGEVIVPDELYFIKHPAKYHKQRIYYDVPNFGKNYVVKRSFISNNSEENNTVTKTPGKGVPEMFVSRHDDMTPTVLSWQQSTEQAMLVKDCNQLIKSSTELVNADCNIPDVMLTNENALLHDDRIQAVETTLTSIEPVAALGQSKADCESINHRNCICSFKQLLMEFENILSRNPEKNVQIVDIVNRKCTSFSPTPESFTLSSDLKPKVLSKAKALVIDDGNGPKEINQRSIEDLLSYGQEDEGTVVYVFLNTNLVLPCFPSDDVHLSTNTNDNTNYTWTHGNNKAITEGRIITDASHMGHLTINNINLQDSDNYTCLVKYVNPDTGHYTDEHFMHTIVVVSLPVIALQAVVHYKAALKCEESILEMFELYLPQQVERALCDIGDGKSLCDVNVHNPVCHTDFVARNNRDLSYTGNRFSSYWRRFKRQGGGDSMEMSLNFELQLRKIVDMLHSITNTSHCKPMCQQKLNLKLIQLIRDNLPAILSIKVASNLGTTFEPILNSIALKYVVGCPGGYGLINGFCTPCKKNHFSLDGATICTVCPKGSYQNQVGARSCIECSNHWIPACNEFTDEYNMTIMIIVLGVVSALFLGSCLLYISFFREKDNMDDETCIRTLTPCLYSKALKKPRPKFAKSARYQKRRVVIYPEENELLLNERQDEDEDEDNDELN